MRFSTVAFTALMAACSSGESNLSAIILNQNHCTLINADKVTIESGDIRVVKSRELIGQITVIDDKNIQVMDDRGATKKMIVKVDQIEPQKRLIYLMNDEGNILIGCGLDID